MNGKVLRLLVFLFFIIRVHANDEFVPYYLSSDPSRTLKDYRNYSDTTRYPTDNYNYKEILSNDIGAQRPVKTKSVGFGYFLGFQTNINYSNNPLGLTNNNPNKYPAGIWSNTLRNNFRLGAFDLGGATFSPILSLNLDRSSFFGDEHYDQPHYQYQNSLVGSFAGIFQLPGNWSIRPSFSFNSQFEKLDITYHEFRPSLAVGKILPLSFATLSFDSSLSYAFAKAKKVTNESIPTDGNNRLEFSLISGLNVPLGNFEINSLLGLTLSRYPNQGNRFDFSTILGLHLRYNLTHWCFFDLSSNYTLRNSNNEDFDFSRLDLASSASLNAKF